MSPATGDIAAMVEIRCCFGTGCIRTACLGGNAEPRAFAFSGAGCADVPTGGCVERLYAKAANRVLNVRDSFGRGLWDTYIRDGRARVQNPAIHREHPTKRGWSPSPKSGPGAARGLGMRMKVVPADEVTECAVPGAASREVRTGPDFPSPLCVPTLLRRGRAPSGRGKPRSSNGPRFFLHLRASRHCCARGRAHSGRGKPRSSNGPRFFLHLRASRHCCARDGRTPGAASREVATGPDFSFTFVRPDTAAPGDGRTPGAASREVRTGSDFPSRSCVPTLLRPGTGALRQPEEWRPRCKIPGLAASVTTVVSSILWNRLSGWCRLAR